MNRRAYHLTPEQRFARAERWARIYGYSRIEKELAARRVPEVLSLLIKVGRMNVVQDLCDACDELLRAGQENYHLS